MSDRERDIFFKVLQEIAENPDLIDNDRRVKTLIKKVYKQGRKQQKKSQKLDQEVVIQEADRHCFICQKKFGQEHNFYRDTCLECGNLNYAKRLQTVDLSGKIALVTGARIRIGYGITLKLLRSGARVIATTRFPHDAAKRYEREVDFKKWSDRIHIYGLDLRYLEGVEYFTQHILNYYSRLDILINNAAQTVRRPINYYRHLIDFESLSLPQLPKSIQPLVEHYHDFCFAENQTKLKSLISIPTTSKNNIALSVDKNKAHFAALLSQIPLIPEDWEDNNNLFPLEKYDRDGEQLDLRSFNSWSMKDEDVNVVELLEVHIINAIAPFMINSRLKSLLKHQPELNKYIINVSSAEGSFSHKSKSWRHPHTNMAKAALNQITRTCAKEYARYRIFMNAVDPGWISFQQPLPEVVAMEEKGMKLPLDSEDGAARIYDLIYLGEAERQYPFGKLFKNYQEVTW